jgi:hypothetical protein
MKQLFQRASEIADGWWRQHLHHQRAGGLSGDFLPVALAKNQSGREMK